MTMCRSSLLRRCSIHRAFRPSSARGPLSVAGTVCFDSRMGGSAPRTLTELGCPCLLPLLLLLGRASSVRYSHMLSPQQDFPGAAV